MPRRSRARGAFWGAEHLTERSGCGLTGSPAPGSVHSPRARRWLVWRAAPERGLRWPTHHPSLGRCPPCRLLVPRAPFTDLSPAPLDVPPRCVRMLCLACGTAGRAMHSRGLCPKAERRRQFVTYEKLIVKDLDLYYPKVRDASDATPLGSTGAP